MFIVTLLITIILIAFFAKPINPNSFRLAIGGIYGILFLIVWPYFRFYADISVMEEFSVTLALVLLAVFAVGLVFLPVVSNIKKIGAASLFALFLVTIAVSFAFESKIKFNIGVLSGYFDDENPINETHLSSATNIFTSQTGGYTVRLPSVWQQQSLMPTGLPFFVLQENGVKKAEFRPKCFHQLEVALPEMVQGIIANTQSIGGASVQKNCFTWHDNYYSCLIQKTGDLSQMAKSRWQWFGVNYDNQQGIELDFVIYENTDRIIRDVKSIIASLEATRLPAPLPNCLGVSAWF